VIQAMKSLPELRSFLYQKGYRIQEERLVFEKRHFYPILHVKWDGIPETLDGLKAWVGPVLLEKKPPLLVEYLSHLRRQMLRQVRGNPALADIIDEVGTTLEALMEEKQDESIEKG
ncbi:MAG: tRNA (adenine(22)-N(1))-methyltransferase TrmK, partial [Clostridia bacterium]|nr:tRNA (adenine(22)-N(1))-methyltransferase TrmK [Clostridia bacterium]